MLSPIDDKKEINSVLDKLSKRLSKQFSSISEDNNYDKARSHDLMLACGQVLIYDFHLKADRRIIVSEELEETPLSSLIIQVLKDHKILYLEYVQGNPEIEFPKLPEILAGLAAKAETETV
jgi:hypothetical protein